MFTETRDTGLADTASAATLIIKRSVAKKRAQVSDNEISEQTQWMLAVRDNRDRAAFARLFDYFAPRLKGVVARSGAPSAQVEDIVQDVMLTVWHKAAQFDPERAQVSSWIYQIARNRQIDILRRENRPLPEELKRPEEASQDASQIVALEQETAQLKKALARLKPAQREMVERAYLGELSHSDIQAETGLPLGTIKSRIRLGLERLRHELKEMGKP
ncbi:sigma-70 family RNA polymerase sigma factor [Marimonas lutisalis]|uniref:sigma-70 family RNA polymerase sigma factor n=1 Tax=Marimonas lutisalis TaxID=2545756 RepID=UPI0038B32D6B